MWLSFYENIHVVSLAVEKEPMAPIAAIGSVEQPWDQKGTSTSRFRKVSLREDRLLDETLFPGKPEASKAGNLYRKRKYR